MEDFIKRYNLASIDVDGSYPNQCVDLAKAWEDWNGWPRINGNAKDQPNYMNKNFYQFIPNTPTGIPQKGDLVIWGMAPYGHIAIFYEGNATSFKSFDQNWPSDLRCRIVNHTYKNVIGWIRPKENEMVTDENLKDAIQFEGDSRVYFWAGNPDIASRWYGPDWAKYVRKVTPQVVEKPVEIVKEIPVEKVVEKPVEVVKEVPVVEYKEKELGQEDTQVLSLYHKIINWIRGVK